MRVMTLFTKVGACSRTFNYSCLSTPSDSWQGMFNGWFGNSIPINNWLDKLSNWTWNTTSNCMPYQQIQRRDESRLLHQELHVERGQIQALTRNLHSSKRASTKSQWVWAMTVDCISESGFGWPKSRVRPSRPFIWNRMRRERRPARRWW